LAQKKLRQKNPKKRRRVNLFRSRRYLATLIPFGATVTVGP
jgi:hypothetical protein